jgi:hypothetical protein
MSADHNEQGDTHPHLPRPPVKGAPRERLWDSVQAAPRLWRRGDMSELAAELIPEPAADGLVVVDDFGPFQ